MTKQTRAAQCGLSQPCSPTTRHLSMKAIFSICVLRLALGSGFYWRALQRCYMRWFRDCVRLLQAALSANSMPASTGAEHIHHVRETCNTLDFPTSAPTPSDVTLFSLSSEWRAITRHRHRQVFVRRDRAQADSSDGPVFPTGPAHRWLRSPCA